MVRVVTVLLLAIATALCSSYLWLRAQDGAYSRGQTIPLDVGFARDLARIETPPDRCLLVRVTADKCGYCRQDQAQFGRVVTGAKNANCAVIEVGPREEAIEAASAGSHLSITYVDLRVGRALMPFVTPQTLILDASRRLLWHRQGALNDKDAGSAERALSRLR